jgi:effector-binding domain-containing protein
VTTHYGPYEAVDQAYEAIQAWLHDRGLRPNGGHWEVYYSDPTEEPDSAKWRTDLFAPYTRDQ